MKNKPFQSGMTLIEIIDCHIAGLVFVGGILQIFAGSKNQTYRMQENLSRLQENGRFAMNFLAHDIRMAGYWGCFVTPNSTTDITRTDNNTVAGFDNGTDAIR